jgi:hypothetical protein
MADSHQPYTDAEIAEACHELNRVLMRFSGTPVDPPWADITWQESAIADVAAARADPGLTPERMHEDWVTRKVVAGWTWGPVRDPERKTHPCIVLGYDDVPLRERVKDTAWLALIRAMDDTGGVKS